MKLLFIPFLLILFTGCHGTIAAFNESIKYDRYEQAAIRLERCANRANYETESNECKECKECKKMIEEFTSTGLPLAEAIKKDYEAKKEIIRLTGFRESNNPWDKLSLALAIQDGIIKEAYLDESSTLTKQAFFGFGECAKQSNSSCMTQYAQMIIYGMGTLTKNEKESAENKAIYWLNLAARFGDEGARNALISLEKKIPTPDLSMEKLQKDANYIATQGYKAKQRAAEIQAYYSSQMLNETRRANFISSMNSFFPETVNCTSSTVGGYTYTNCR